MSSDIYIKEILLLQRKDSYMAFKLGFKNKKAWVNHILKLNEDMIARDIISLALKYNLNVYNVARDFDESMVSRVLKIKSQK